MKRLLIYLIMALTLASCTTQREYVYQNHIDTVYVAKQYRDSVYIYETAYASNDTIYLTRYHYRDKYHYDTILSKEIKDSIVYRDRVVTKTETSPASGFTVVCTILFWLLIALALAYIIYRIVKGCVKK